MTIDFDSRAQSWDAHQGHAARTRAIASGIRSRAPLARTMRALEVGAGTGLLGLELRDDVGSILFTDTSAGMIEVLQGKLAEGGWSHLRAQLLDLATDRPQGPFDLVFSQMALHHVPDVPGHLAILHELMAPGAWLCIADLDKEDGSFHGEGIHVHKGFDRDELRNWALSAGFEPVEIETVYQLPREVDGAVHHFPVFLLIARRP